MVLLREIKRRRVLHTLSLYIVGCWVALQVVEVLSDAGLPPNTMRYLLMAMSAGFPLVLLVAWFFDVTPEGVSRTRRRTDGAELPHLNLGDHALLVGIIAVLVLNAYVLSSPAPQGPAGPAGTTSQTLAVLAFAGEGDDAIGDAIAAELRSELQRFAGLKVLGPETSRAIQAAGERRNAIARELGVTTLLVGDARLEEGHIRVSARVHRMPAGNTVWTSDYDAPVGDGPAVLAEIASAVLDVIVPSAVADTPHGPRIDAGACSQGYKDYLRGRQLLTMAVNERAREPLIRATQLDPECGIAWAALAWAHVDWTLAGFAKAGAAARRALEINDALAEAWAVLAEIAEEEKRWGEAERLYLKALYLDPSNARVNAMYSETLMTRGRVRDSLQYALEAYRFEPASHLVNFRVQLSSRYAGEADLLIEHAKIGLEIANSEPRKEFSWEAIADGYLMKGDVQEAARIIEEHIRSRAEWYPRCIRSNQDSSLRDGLKQAMLETLRQYYAGELSKWQAWTQPWQVIRCAIFLDEPEVVVDFLTAEDFPTELDFTLFFLPDAGVLRQTEHFRNLVVDSGLLDYWREWGFADYCRPDGESFACD